MRPLPSLLAGLALGFAGSMVLRHQVGRTPPAPAPGLSPPAVSLLPPVLAPAESDAALDAWLALGAPAGESPPADFDRQSATLRALLTVLDDSAFPRLLATLLGREGEAAARLFETAFTVWCERAPASAARWIAALPAGHRLDPVGHLDLCGEAALAWGRLDFDAAHAWAGSLSDTALLRHVASRLVLLVAATDPARALALAQPRGAEFVESIQRDLFELWQKQDPAAAVRTLGPIALEFDRYSLPLHNAVAFWLARDAPAALDWLVDERHFGRAGMDIMISLVLSEALSEIPRPRALADALAQRSDLRDQSEYLALVLQKWAFKDPTPALAWLASLPDPAQRASLLDRALPDRFDGLQGPDRYLPLALHLPPGEKRVEMVASLLDVWSLNHPETALAWLKARDDPAFADSAIQARGRLLVRLAATDPAAALADWPALPAGQAKAAVAVELALAWSGHDPGAATRWVAEQTDGHPDSAPSDKEWTTLLYVWAQKDPLGALRWIETLPDDASRMPAIRALDGDWERDRSDRATHADLLARLTDPRTRSAALDEHLRNWLRVDLPAARAWIESHDELPPEAAARLLDDATDAP